MKILIVILALLGVALATGLHVLDGATGAIFALGLLIFGLGVFRFLKFAIGVALMAFALDS